VSWNRNIKRHEERMHKIFWWTFDTRTGVVPLTFPLHGSVTNQSVNSSGTLRKEPWQNAWSRLRVLHWQRGEHHKTKQHLPLNDSQQTVRMISVVLTDVECRYWSRAWRHRATLKVDTTIGNDLQLDSWTDVLWWETNWDIWQLTSFMQ
jgi:hypothetical protein